MKSTLQPAHGHFVGRRLTPVWTLSAPATSLLSYLDTRTSVMQSGLLFGSEYLDGQVDLGHPSVLPDRTKVGMPII